MSFLPGLCCFSSRTEEKYVSRLPLEHELEVVQILKRKISDACLRFFFLFEQARNLAIGRGSISEVVFRCCGSWSYKKEAARSRKTLGFRSLSYAETGVFSACIQLLRQSVPWFSFSRMYLFMLGSPRKVYSTARMMLSTPPL